MHAVPGVQKLSIRIGNVEERCESIDKRVESLDVSSDVVKDLVQEKVSELREIESPKLDMICLNLPESKKLDMRDRQQEDQDFLNNLLETKVAFTH